MVDGSQKWMRFKLLSSLLMSCGLHAISVSDYDKGLLNSSEHQGFTGSGSTKLGIQTTTQIEMRSNYGVVLLSGNGWEFSDHRILADDLDITDSQHFDDCDVLTIVGSYMDRSYDIEFIKHYRNRHERLRMIAVRPSIPESSTWTALMGLLAGAFAFLKRR